MDAVDFAGSTGFSTPFYGESSLKSRAFVFVSVSFSVSACVSVFSLLVFSYSFCSCGFGIFTRAGNCFVSL